MTVLQTIYRIPNGQTVTTELMSPEYHGGIFYLFFYNAGGVQVTPTGSPTVERKVGDRWIVVQRYGQDEWRFNTPCESVRISLTGVSGYTTYQGYCWRSNNLIGMEPSGLYSGLRAVTVQNYTEANVKTGVQYELSSNVAALAGLANNDLILVTGTNPVIIKSRELTFTGVSLTARAYQGPTYTGGSQVPYFNMNTRNPVAGTMQVIAGATVTGVGTEVAAPTYGVGGSGLGLSVVGTFRAQGVERILAPNTTWLFRITNNDLTPQRVVTYATWYEGGTDLPIP